MTVPNITNTTPNSIEDIEKRLKNRTQGKWMICLGSGMNLATGVKCEDPQTGESMFIADFLSDRILNESEISYDHRDNMNFVANAPEDIEFLLGELYASWNKIAKLEEYRNACEDQIHRLNLDLSIVKQIP
jgi:hypothetical protein